MAEERDLRVFVGPYAHSESDEYPLVTVKDGVIGVESGKILFVGVRQNLNNLKSKYNFGRESIYNLSHSEFLMPGFVDTHVHAALCMNAGMGVLGHEKELRECLKKYTLSSEINFKDPALAKSCYTDIVKATLTCGTTTATYYASVYRESCEILADVCEDLGQRALIGKVCMNMASPDEKTVEQVLENTPECLIMTEQFVRNILNRKSNLLKPVITPKSPLACTEELLQGLGQIAQKHGIHIQSHLCESEEDNNRILDLFPQYKSYIEIYQKSGLFTNKSVMAHCVHVNDADIEALQQTSTAVSHCPTSNICHERGLCPVRKLMSVGIKVGLGTNVSAAFSTSMLQTMRHAILTSKIIRISNFSNKPLTFADSFYLATLGGAEALSMDKEIGNFEIGKSFDALRINVSSIGSPFSFLNRETMMEKIQKFIMLGDQRNIVEVYVEGRKVNHFHGNRWCKLL